VRALKCLYNGQSRSRPDLDPNGFRTLRARYNFGTGALLDITWRALVTSRILPSLLFLSSTSSSRLMTFRLVAPSTLSDFSIAILFFTHVFSNHSLTVNSIFYKINLLRVLPARANDTPHRRRDSLNQTQRRTGSRQTTWRRRKRRLERFPRSSFFQLYFCIPRTQCDCIAI
jgi:hypothetical protein